MALERSIMPTNDGAGRSSPESINEQAQFAIVSSNSKKRKVSAYNPINTLSSDKADTPHRTASKAVRNDPQDLNSVLHLGVGRSIHNSFVMVSDKLKAAASSDLLSLRSAAKSSNRTEFVKSTSNDTLHENAKIVINDPQCTTSAVAETKIVENILFPDERVSLKSEYASTRCDASACFDLKYIQIGNHVVDSDGCLILQLLISDAGYLQISIGLAGKSDAAIVTFGRKDIERIHFHDSTSNQYVDMHLFSLPPSFGTVGFALSGRPPIIARLSLCSGYRADLRHSLHRNFPSHCAEQKDSIAYGERASSLCSSFEQIRRSNRIAVKSSPQSQSSESPDRLPLTRLSSSFSRKRSIFRLSDPTMPVLPEKPVPLFVFPEDGVGSVTITTADTPRLEPGVFLNDSIVDFDLRYSYEGLDPHLQGRVHVFSSFFYQRLLDEGHSGVRTWTEDGDIFARDFLVIPICENSHWYLAIVCYPRLMLSLSTKSNVIDLSDESDEKKTSILIFDSLGRNRSATLSRLKTYLVDEAADKLSLEAHRLQTQGTLVKCPRQDNCYDCGLFCGQYMESFFTDPDKAMSEALRDKLANWFPTSLASERRQRLKELVGRLESTSTYQQVAGPEQSSDYEEIICLS